MTATTRQSHPARQTRTLPMIGLVVFLALLAGLGAIGILDLLSASRAYVAGEGHWSRAVHTAVFHLDRYAELGEPEDLTTARSELRIPLGDRAGRMALDRDPPDLETAHSGFREGRNHVEDIPRLIRMYRYFGGWSHFRDAVQRWEETDVWLLRLQALASEIERIRGRSDPSPNALRSIRDELGLISEMLAQKGSAFSESIGLGSRALTATALILSLALIAILSVFVLIAFSWAVRGIRNSELRFWSIFEQAPVGMALIGNDGTMLEINDALCRFLHRSRDALVARPLSEFCEPDHRGSLRKMVAMAEHSPADESGLEIRYLRPDGSRVWGKLSLARIHRESTGEPLQVAVLEDVSEPRRLSGELAYQAAHDQLTGLPNRREFERVLNHVLHDAAQQKSEHVLCLIDLDQFKIVNDTFGHLAGDALLVRLSEQMQACLRDNDFLARLDGDEFGVILMNCGAAIAKRVSERLRDTIEAFRFQWEEKPISISASIGLVLIDSTNLDSANLLQQVDIACHEAKDMGRNQVCMRSPAHSSSIRRHEEMAWVNRINEALANNQLRFHGQLIAPTTDGAWRCELLLRMQDNEGHVHTASQFMDAAERFHIARAVDRWVIENSLAQIRIAQRKNPRIESWHINLSGQSVDCESVLPDIIKRIGDHGIPPQRLCFEITESAAIHSIDEAQTFFNRLRELGCQVALDDFGKGLSTFDYLKQLPVDLVKIDGGFVRELAHSELDHAMVRSIHEIAQIAGLQTVAESVESIEVMIRLKQIGVDYLQGHVIHSPTVLSELRLPKGSLQAISEQR